MRARPARWPTSKLAEEVIARAAVMEASMPKQRYGLGRGLDALIPGAIE